MLKDFLITLQDTTGRKYDLFISADCIRDVMMATGVPLEQAIEDVTQNAGENAISRGDIGRDCWISHEVAE